MFIFNLFSSLLIRLNEETEQGLRSGFVKTPPSHNIFTARHAKNSTFKRDTLFILHKV